MIRHALAEGWLILCSRGPVSLVLALALAIPISLAGVTVSLRQWLEPVIGLSDRESIVSVLLHPRLDENQRRLWISDQGRSHPDWKVVNVEPEELAIRLASWFPYLEEVLQREGPQMLPHMVEITTHNPQSVLELKETSAVLAVGPTSSVNRMVGEVSRRFALVLLLVAGALVAGAMLLAAVWVHLELHRNAEEIAIMRLMGATEATVRGPFFVAVVVPALLAAVISVALTVVAVGWTAQLAAPLGLAVRGASFVVLAGQVLGAIGLPMVAAFITLERHASSEES